MNFIPALKYHLFTPYYDKFIRFFMPEIKIKKQIIELAEIKENNKVLDFGCGTGTLIIQVKREIPNCQITGVDVDQKILQIAVKKLIKENVKSDLICLESQKLPFPDNYFDVILSTWVFHHLERDAKIKAFKELNRVMKRESKFILGDWGLSENLLMRFLFFILQVFDNFKTTADNVNGDIPSLLTEANFIQSKPFLNKSTLFGTFTFWKIKVS